MSSVALQRAIVRMLYDPVFAQAVYADPVATLGGTGVELDEARWITASDPRAYGIDPYRRSRSLHALMEEFPVSCAHARPLGGDVVFLHEFFSDAIFHEGMQNGTSIAALFADYLQHHLCRDHLELVPVVQLEAAMARARRHRAQPDDRWQLADGVALLLDVAIEPNQYAMLLGSLGDPQRRIERLLSEDAQPVVSLPEPGECRSMLICVRDEVEIELLAEELAGLLAVAQHGARREHWEELAWTLDVPFGDISDSLEELAGDGILSAPIAG